MSYNSYKPSYRGRGGGFNSRGGGGGYRGSRGDGGGGSWGGSRGRGGSGFSGSGRGSGRFSGGSSWDKEVGMETTRSRYAGGDYGGGNDRYSSRGGDDGAYGRRYSRQGVSPDYGNRDHHRNSPDQSRKRMRTDSYQGSSSLRRTHEDSSYGGGNDYSHSYGSFGSNMDDKGGAGGYGDRSRVYRDDRDHSRNDDYQYKKLMGPPSGPPRRSSPRGSFRGGRSFMHLRSVGGYAGRRFYKRGDRIKSSLGVRKMMEPSYSIRKREYLQRLKLYKLKRLADRLKSVKTGSKEDEDKKKAEKVNGEELDEDLDDEEEIEIEVEEEVETSVEEEEDEEEEEGEEKEVDDEDEEEDGEVDSKTAVQNGIKKEKDDELEEGETHEDGEVAAAKKKPKKKIVRKKVMKIVKKKIKKEKGTPKRTKENEDSKEGGNLQVTIKQDSESRAVNDESHNKTYLGRPFIRLDCRHCNIRCVTFKEYSMHLLTTKHLASMRKLALKLRQQLARMRIDQRREQLILDAKHKDNPKLRTFFCSTCKLNHRSLKGEHIASIRHKKMREFLMPYCRVCRITFRSPMAYENHMCDLDHVKRAAKLEYLIAKRKGEKEEAGRNVDMDNFMILDSVGSPDESEEEEEDGDKEGADKDNVEGTEAGEKAEKKKKKRSEIKLGLEYCKKIEVMFCDLCSIYLPRNQPHEKVVAQHCRTRVHLERLVRANKYKRRSHHGHSKSKDDKTEHDKKEGDGDKSAGNEMDTSTGPSPAKKKTDASGEHDDGDIDEKLWSEVDKDLGDLLREVEPEAKSSDEEEEQGRYDRFKLSEKDKADEDGKNRSNKLASAPSDKSGREEEEDDEEEDEDDDEGKDEKSET